MARRGVGALLASTTAVVAAASLAAVSRGGDGAGCPVTAPNGSSPSGWIASARNHGNGILWVNLPPESTVVLTPQELGRRAYKFPWWRGSEGSLAIEARRLDGPAPPASTEIPTGYGPSGNQPTSIVFPAAGCWELTGRVGDATLTVVVLVAVRAAPPSADCAATPVRYGWNREAPADASPWIAAGRGQARIVGHLYTLGPTLGDARVRDAAGLTVYAGALHKIVWLPRRWSGTGPVLTIAGRRLDGAGSFRARHPRALAPQFYPSGVRLPTAGCWRLTLTTGSRRWTLHVRAIDPPAEPPCDATVVRGGPNPVDPFFTTWIAASPRSSRISASFSVSVPGVEGAAIYSGGKWPTGANTKVLWLVDEPSGLLRISGTRLDAKGSFEQTERAAASPSYAYPSILVVPQPGCWLLTLRTSGRGGVVVMRALAP